MWATTPRTICRVREVHIKAVNMNTAQMFQTPQATTIPITAVTTAVTITAATQATAEEIIQAATPPAEEIIQAENLQAEEIIQAENLQAEGNPQAEAKAPEAVNRQAAVRKLPLPQNKITG